MFVFKIELEELRKGVRALIEDRDLPCPCPPNDKETVIDIVAHAVSSAISSAELVVNRAPGVMSNDALEIVPAMFFVALSALADSAVAHIRSTTRANLVKMMGQEVMDELDAALGALGPDMDSAALGKLAEKFAGRR